VGLGGRALRAREEEREIQMSDSLSKLLDQVSREKRIAREILVQALEESIQKAAQRIFGEGRELEAVFNEETGQVELYQYMVVVEIIEDPNTDIPIDKAMGYDPESMVGDELGFRIYYREEDRELARDEDERYGDILGVKTHLKTFGRIAASVAKQVIFQKIREAESQVIYDKYKDRKGELVTGSVRRFERGAVIVDIGSVEAILPREEQVRKESYRAGDRVQAVIVDVRNYGKGPQIVVSRTTPMLIQRMFEMEVPEIYEGIVRLVGIARDPGERTKIAVSSSDPDVDPVGACVGMKGSRVQSIVMELRGEKIDIVPFSADLVTFVCNAIGPAEVSRVLVDEDKKLIELIVPDDQLSLAIGKRGQNVRLANRLVGWDIAIFTESRIDEMKDALRNRLIEIDGVDESVIDYLLKLGYHSIESLADIDEDEIGMMPGFSREVIVRIKEVATEAKQRTEDGVEAATPAAEPKKDDEVEAPATEVAPAGDDSEGTASEGDGADQPPSDAPAQASSDEEVDEGEPVEE
jgi:transcription termination/antitermination protein NusA